MENFFNDIRFCRFQMALPTTPAEGKPRPAVVVQRRPSQRPEATPLPHGPASATPLPTLATLSNTPAMTPEPMAAAGGAPSAAVMLSSDHPSTAPSPQGMASASILASSHVEPYSGSDAGVSDRSGPTTTSFKDLKTAQSHIQTLENEILDLKRTLLDAIYDKQVLESEKQDLQRLVQELSGSEVNLGDEDVVSERAKGTILLLRLRRVEARRGAYVESVKMKGVELQNRLAGVKSCMSSLKLEVKDQLERSEQFISNGLVAFEGLLNSASQRAVAAIGGGLPDASDGGDAAGDATDSCGAAGGNGTYLSMVTAAVTMQQKTTILAQDHPVLEKLGQLLNNIDGAMEKLNKQWGRMVCFVDGRAPVLTRPRRYMDPITNLQNYILRVQKMQRAASVVELMDKIHSESCLPQLTEKVQQGINEASASMELKLQKLFDAMRLIRSSVVVRQKNLSTALRIILSADTIASEASRLNSQYRALCRMHTKRIFHYIASTMRFGRSAEVKFAYVPHPTVVGNCGSCKLSITCDDCRQIASVVDVGQRLWLERRRTFVARFSQERLDHIAQLVKLVDDAQAVLVKARLVPLVTNQGQDVNAQTAESILLKPYVHASDNYFTRLRFSERARLDQHTSMAQNVSMPAIEEHRADERMKELLQVVSKTALLSKFLSPTVLAQQRSLLSPSPRSSATARHNGAAVGVESDDEVGNAETSHVVAPQRDSRLAQPIMLPFSRLAEHAVVSGPHADDYLTPMPLVSSRTVEASKRPGAVESGGDGGSGVRASINPVVEAHVRYGGSPMVAPPSAPSTARGTSRPRRTPYGANNSQDAVVRPHDPAATARELAGRQGHEARYQRMRQHLSGST